MSEIIGMSGIIEWLKRYDIELWMVEWKNKTPLINTITEAVKYFEKRWGKVFNEVIIGNNISWFQVFYIWILIFSKGKIDNELPKNIRSMIINWIINDKWWLKYNWTLYKFSEDQSDISFKEIANTLFGKDFSDYLKSLIRIWSHSIVAFKLNIYLSKLNSGEIIDIWKVLYELMKTFQEIEENNKWKWYTE
ncbi:MAG: hypothetical protein ACD_49C00064G0021 [uncultured bacterium (gcode 4)]|uniref:Uncharacterized protein n=1 Tax=uncultured bacterium (gcode 4) TaxID=1234023 RepID=K2BBJ1_9BACT|nr:MAG: hypothetical protein ACD_49C00064G0021 [uncultured bacterium (gcode 4)]